MEYCRRKILSFLKTRREKEKEERSLVNGSALLEEFIVSFNGKHNIPIRSFTARELRKATNNFAEEERVMIHGYCVMFRGSFEQRPILVQRYHGSISDSIHDIVITSQMCRHKNVLKLSGCCLEFRIPALVYDYSGTTKLLSDLLYNREDRYSLSWKLRLRIAKDIANVVVYLHTSFSTPIIFRDLKPSLVMVDQDGVAQLFDFSFSISLPPGESQVQDSLVVGTFGYAEPEYLMTGIVTEKCDVYSFGVLLLVLLTAQKPHDEYHGYDGSGLLTDLVKEYVDKDRFNEIVDPRILGEGSGGFEQEQQLQAFLALALQCVKPKGEDRPDMIDVAKELRRIERSPPC